MAGTHTYVCTPKYLYSMVIVWVGLYTVEKDQICPIVKHEWTPNIAWGATTPLDEKAIISFYFRAPLSKVSAHLVPILI